VTTTTRITDLSEYGVWAGMLDRCRNPNSLAWRYYGGRGIRVCGEWQGRGGFARFFFHVGPRPTGHHSIDRINNNGHYEPGNVRWATRQEQARNRRCCRKQLPERQRRVRSEVGEVVRLDEAVLGRLKETLVCQCTRNAPSNAAFASTLPGLPIGSTLISLSAVGVRHDSQGAQVSSERHLDRSAVRRLYDFYVFAPEAAIYGDWSKPGWMLASPLTEARAWLAPVIDPEAVDFDELAAELSQRDLASLLGVAGVKIRLSVRRRNARSRKILFKFLFRSSAEDRGRWAGVVRGDPAAAAANGSVSV